MNFNVIANNSKSYPNFFPDYKPFISSNSKIPRVNEVETEKLSWITDEPSKSKESFTKELFLILRGKMRKMRNLLLVT